MGGLASSYDTACRALSISWSSQALSRQGEQPNDRIYNFKQIKIRYEMWFYSWLSIIICFLYSARFVEKAAWKSLRSSGPFSTPQLLVSRVAYRGDYNCCECRQMIKENSSWHVTSWRMTQARLLASGMYLCICCVLFRELKRLPHLSASRAMTVREVWKLVWVARTPVRSLHWHARRNVCPRPEIDVNNNHILRSYLAGDIGHLSCVNQPVNAA